MASVECSSTTRIIPHSSKLDKLRTEDDDNHTTCTATTASESMFSNDCDDTEFLDVPLEGIGKTIFDSLDSMLSQNSDVLGNEGLDDKVPGQVEGPLKLEEQISDIQSPLDNSLFFGSGRIADIWNMDLDDVLARAESFTDSQDAVINRSKIPRKKCSSCSISQNTAQGEDKKSQPNRTLRKKKNKTVKNEAISQPSSYRPILLKTKSSRKDMNKREKKSVRFDMIQVRVYERILDVNPECSTGPSLGIGWKYKPLENMNVDFWEAYRKGSRRRSSNQLIMTKAQRERIALKIGHTEAEIIDNARANRVAKNQRLCTVNNLNMHKMELAVEKSRRKLSKMLSVTTRTRGSF